MQSDELHKGNCNEPEMIHLQLACKARKEYMYRRVKKNMNCNPAPVCIAASQLLRQAQTRLGSLNFCLIWMGQVIWSDYVYIAFSLCEKNTFLQECIWEMFFRCEYIVFFLDVQMRCDVSSHGLRTPRESFFSNFWAWADILGWNILRHLGYFRPDYQHPLWYCEFLVHVFNYLTIISSKNQDFLSNSQIFIWKKGFEFGPQRIWDLAFVCP